MEILSLAAARSSNDPLRAQMGRLIEVVGTPRFEAELFRIARGAVNCAHVAAFSFPRDGTAHVVVAASTGTLQIARSLGEKYLAQYRHLDPINRVTQFGDANNTSMAMRIAPEQDIDDDAYRLECFSAASITDRFTLTQISGSNVYRLNFYAGGGYGRFCG
jgi:hypothetical protein